jgi:hypothetical protein
MWTNKVNKNYRADKKNVIEKVHCAKPNERISQTRNALCLTQARTYA